MSHWLYNGEPFVEVPEKAHGFVYRITNTQTGKRYIGRKAFASTRRKPLTKTQKASGRKKRTVIRSESDWKTYTGSNTTLNEEIEKNGKNSLIFEILVVCYTKGQLNYVEENIQHQLQVVWDDSYYNDCVGSGKWRSVKLTDNIINQLKNLVS